MEMLKNIGQNLMDFDPNLMDFSRFFEKSHGF